MPSSDPDPATGLDRRGFLAVATRALLWITGGASAVALGRYLAYEPPVSPSTVYTLEAPDAYTAGGMTLVAAGRAALYRDERGFFARSMTCGHLGCRVRQDGDQGFICPCHGSRYAQRGDRVQGPAPNDLSSVALSLDGDGRLVLDLATPVDAAWRLALPTASRPASLEAAAVSGG